MEPFSNPITYSRRHNCKTSAKRVAEITSNFIQAREYFFNAENASLLVKPLLLYYGVLGLSRGLILMLKAGISEAAMKPSHGINAHKWQETLSSDLTKIGALEIQFCDGTFKELIEETENKSYLRHNTSIVNYHLEYPQPLLENPIIFQNLVETFPDVSKEVKAWFFLT